MSKETPPPSPLEVEDWAESELDPTEMGDLTANVVSNVDYLVRTAENSLDGAEYHREKIELCDDKGSPVTTISLEAFVTSYADDWELAPLPAWNAKLRLDERLTRLDGYNKPATVFRRTYVNVEPLTEDPIRIVRTHELRRRSRQKFSRPKNRVEKHVLGKYQDFDRTKLRQQDRALIEGAFAALEYHRDEVPEEAGGSGYED